MGGEVSLGIGCIGEDKRGGEVSLGISSIGGNKFGVPHKHSPLMNPMTPRMKPINQ